MTVDRMHETEIRPSTGNHGDNKEHDILTGNKVGGGGHRGREETQFFHN